MPTKEGATTKRFHTHNFTIQASKGVRFEIVNDAEYMIAPCVAVMETVLNGVLLPAKEIDRFPTAWNGVPCPVGHPYDAATGWPVSAKTPDQIFRTAGWFFNTTVDAEDQHKLRGEIWFDVQRANTIGSDVERAYSQIRNGYESEVSSAFFADIEDTSGTYNGVEYFGIFRNLIPDHVAVLLDERGACSREDGCGCPQAQDAESGATLHTNKENTMDRDSIIEALIACDCCELDRDTLSALSDDALVAMASMRDNFATIRGDLNSQIETLNANAENDDADGADDAGEEPVDEDAETDSEDSNEGEPIDNATVDEAVFASFMSVVGEFGGIDKFVSKLNALKDGETGHDEHTEIVKRIAANSSLTEEMIVDLTIEALTALEADLTPANYGGRAIRSRSQSGGKTTKLEMPKVDDVE